MSITQILENYKDLLTPDEINNALMDAHSTKRAAKNFKKWQEEIRKPKVYPKPTAPELYELILAKAEKEIEGFELSGPEQIIYKNIALYFTKDARFETGEFSLKKGLMLCGNIGCGKTTLMRLFTANPNQSYFVRSVRAVVDEYKLKDDGGTPAIDKYSNLWANNGVSVYGHRELGICFDDLGTEVTAKHFGNELNVMSEIILNRYDYAKGPYTHITTNLNSDQIQQNYGARCRSRMREMFNMIVFPNVKDKRK